MQEAARELERIARTARRLLLSQRLALFLAVALGVAVLLGVMDYLLRLPGALRLLILLLLAAAAGWWWVTRWSRWQTFRPTMSDLALRAERLYPALAHTFATRHRTRLGGEPGTGNREQINPRRR